MKRFFNFLATFSAMICAVVLIGCSGNNATYVGEKVAALDASAWEASAWISAADAVVLQDGNKGRAAEGASWFVSTLKIEQKVTSAIWMTSSLGVYEIYINGKPVGGEFLKPGFTHP